MANWKLPELNVGLYYITITGGLSIAMFDYQRVQLKDSSPSGTHKKHHALSPGFGVEEFQQPLGNLYMEYSFGA